jgi:hypothetical protein
MGFDRQSALTPREDAYGRDFPVSVKLLWEKINK